MKPTTQAPRARLDPPPQPKAAPEPPKPALASCGSCKWRFKDGRCHFHPPIVRLPYDNYSSWPVVPLEGLCGQHSPL